MAEVSCGTCGYKWIAGQHGGHSCPDNMSKTIDSLRQQNEKMAEVIRSTLSSIDAYPDHQHPMTASEIRLRKALSEHDKANGSVSNG